MQQLDFRATNLALNLLDLGIRPLDRLVVQLPNRVQFAYLYLALQKIGADTGDGAARASLSRDQPVRADRRCRRLGHARQASRFRFPRSDRAHPKRTARARARHRAWAKRDADFISLDELIAKKSTRDPAELSRIKIDPTDPALFLLSGGTTGVPKLIPRTHNDYVYNSKMAGSVTGIDDDSVLLDVLPISHNLPLACPGLQGFRVQGREGRALHRYLAGSRVPPRREAPCHAYPCRAGAAHPLARRSRRSRATTCRRCA